eukprot:6488659-Amphidinium_carterae.1
MAAAPLASSSSMSAPSCPLAPRDSPLAATVKREMPAAKRRRTATGKKGMPAAMEGCVTHIKDKAPICFQYNVGQCSANKQPGERCSRGLRVCAKDIGGGALLVQSTSRTLLMPDGAATCLPRNSLSLGMTGLQSLPKKPFQLMLLLWQCACSKIWLNRFLNRWVCVSPPSKLTSRSEASSSSMFPPRMLFP